MIERYTMFMDQKTQWQFSLLVSSPLPAKLMSQGWCPWGLEKLEGLVPWPAACSFSRTQGMAMGVLPRAQSQWHAGRSRAQLPSTHLTPSPSQVISLPFVPLHWVLSIVIAPIYWVLPRCQAQCKHSTYISHLACRPYDCLQMKKLKQERAQGGSYRDSYQEVGLQRACF